MDWNIESENKKRIDRIIREASPQVKGIAPSVIMVNPKHPHNVGSALRGASSFGIEQIWITGTRAAKHLLKQVRVPRELRLEAYGNTEILHSEKPLNHFKDDITPVAVELLPGAQSLVSFEHPKNAVYIFGPEDGDVPKALRVLCHDFVVIPTNHCLNVAVAMQIVLYDRMAKLLGPLGLAA